MKKHILLEVCVSNPLKEYVIHIVQTVERSRRFKPTLHEKCPNTKFSRIRAEYGEMRSISPYSVRMRENTDQKAPYLDTFHAELMAQFQSQR